MVSGQVQILLSHITIREGLDMPVVVNAATREAHVRTLLNLL